MLPGFVTVEPIIRVQKEYAYKPLKLKPYPNYKTATPKVNTYLPKRKLSDNSSKWKKVKELMVKDYITKQSSQVIKPSPRPIKQTVASYVAPVASLPVSPVSPVTHSKTQSVKPERVSLWDRLAKGTIATNNKAKPNHVQTRSVSRTRSVSIQPTSKASVTRPPLVSTQRSLHSLQPVHQIHTLQSPRSKQQSIEPIIPTDMFDKMFAEMYDELVQDTTEKGDTEVTEVTEDPIDLSSTYTVPDDDSYLHNLACDFIEVNIEESDSICTGIEEFCNIPDILSLDPTLEPESVNIDIDNKDLMAIKTVKKQVQSKIDTGRKKKGNVTNQTPSQNQIVACNSFIDKMYESYHTDNNTASPYNTLGTITERTEYVPPTDMVSNTFTISDSYQLNDSFIDEALIPGNALKVPQFLLQQLNHIQPQCKEGFNGIIDKMVQKKIADFIKDIEAILATKNTKQQRHSLGNEMILDYIVEIINVFCGYYPLHPVQTQLDTVVVTGDATSSVIPKDIYEQQLSYIENYIDTLCENSKTLLQDMKRIKLHQKNDQCWYVID